MVYNHGRTVIRGLDVECGRGGAGQVAAKLTEKLILQMKDKYCLCPKTYNIKKNNRKFNKL
jgi:hypothetical protein